MSKVTVVNIKSLEGYLNLKKDIVYSYIDISPITIDIGDIDFSGLTIVLGKNGGNSSKIVDKISSRLETLGINYYVSDIDKLTSDILNQAALENPNDKILAIRVGGEQNIFNCVSIISDTHNSFDSEFDVKNSDSLAIMLKDSIDNSVIVGGKRDINSKYPIRVNTDLAKFINKSEFTNPMIKNVTISINDRYDLSLDKLSSDIVCGIAKFCCLSMENQNKSYLVLENENDLSGKLTVLESNPLLCNYRVALPTTNNKKY